MEAGRGRGKYKPRVRPQEISGSLSRTARVEKYQFNVFIEGAIREQIGPFENRLSSQRKNS
jgi:hypothetical protein